MAEDVKEQEKARESNGRWVSGVSGNTSGKGVRKSPRYLLLEAIQAYEDGKSKDLMMHMVEQAFEDNKVLVALMKKLLPDLRHTNIDGQLAIKTLADIAAAVGATRLPERLQDRIGATN